MNRDANAMPAAAPQGEQSRGALARLADLVLTSDFKQRRSLKLVLLTAFVHSVSLLMVAYGTMQGLFPTGPARVMACVVIASTSSFYIVIRSGLNKRFAEPSLGFPQALAAQFLAAGAYAVSGPVHAVALMLFALVMVFAMFDMKVGHARALAAYSIGLLGAVIAWRTHTDPTVYILEIEMFYFVIGATVFISISQLATLLSNMRRRLTAQKNELQSALAHIQEMATHDELTGLANRRHILDLLNQHAMRHARGGPSFYVAMADLDHFKHINDAHGHAIGDEALRTFARQAQAQLRNTDVIGRWGGEEFLLLMPETPPGDPNVGLERLRANLADCPASAQVPELRVRFSAGLSRYRDGEAVGDTIERADRAAYAAKKAGRDRTVAL
jgi:diguanylate cyclase (GGDEF)-like protein